MRKGREGLGKEGKRTRGRAREGSRWGERGRVKEGRGERRSGEGRRAAQELES